MLGCQSPRNSRRTALRDQRLIYGAVAILIAGLASSGCSSDGSRDTYPATVEITYRNGGKPVRGAIVTFRSLADKSITARGQADVDGVCTLTTYERDDGAVLGDHEATVVGSVGEGDIDETRAPTVNPMFSSFATAKLKFTVTEDESKNLFKIAVTP